MTAALLWLKLRAWAKPGLESGADLLARIGWKGGCITLTVLSVFLTIQLVTQPAKIRDRIVTKVERRIEKAEAKEVVRRETVLKKVQVRSLLDVRELDRLQTRIANLQEASKNASASLDNSACLDRSSVMRLAEVH